MSEPSFPRGSCQSLRSRSCGAERMWALSSYLGFQETSPPCSCSESKSVSPLKGIHAEFSSQLINYAVLTLATVSLSLCKHEAVPSGKGVGRAGCQDSVETREQFFEYRMVFTPALGVGLPNTCLQQPGRFHYECRYHWGWFVCEVHGQI